MSKRCKSDVASDEEAESEVIPLNELLEACDDSDLKSGKYFFNFKLSSIFVKNYNSMA